MISLELNCPPRLNEELLLTPEFWSKAPLIGDLGLFVAGLALFGGALLSFDCDLNAEVPVFCYLWLLLAGAL